MIHFLDPNSVFFQTSSDMPYSNYFVLAMKEKNHTSTNVYEYLRFHFKIGVYLYFNQD